MMCLLPVAFLPWSVVWTISQSPRPWSWFVSDSTFSLIHSLQLSLHSLANVLRECLSNPSFLFLPTSTILGERSSLYIWVTVTLPGNLPRDTLARPPGLGWLLIPQTKSGKPQEEDALWVFFKERRKWRGGQGGICMNEFASRYVCLIVGIYPNGKLGSWLEIWN